MNFPLLLVDTPEFLDAKGLKRDLQITEKIGIFLKTKIDKIHCVCLVSNSNLVRWTTFYRYLSGLILEAFGKDIEDNIANFFTFNDSGPAQVLRILKLENIPLKFSYKFNNFGFF